MTAVRHVDVLVVGAGPAGLTAAARLAPPAPGGWRYWSGRPNPAGCPGPAPTAASAPGSVRSPAPATPGCSPRPPNGPARPCAPG
ncbi:hypothetical protein ACFQ3Z_39045 [Streptomyces nogalater]